MDAATIHRRVTVKPAMCGHNSLFVGQVGDWTWDTVEQLCGTDVLNARNGEGNPTYLAFYYYRIRASPRLHLRSITFGDRLDVDSQSYNFGSESVLTLHRIRRAGMAEPPSCQPVDPVEFYDRPRPDCLYVENFNRWITRSAPGSNAGLVRSAPVDFRYEHLPVLPEQYSPRLAYRRAREQLTFHDPDLPGYDRCEPGLELEYPVDITRDVNGVGLIYFAAYFSMIDWALLRLWRHQGRDARSFLDRVVLDHRLCYLANAQLDSVLRITLTQWNRQHEPAEEVVNVTMQDQSTGATIAVSTLWVLPGGAR